MREIKFRAWDKVNLEMSDVLFVDTNSNGITLNGGKFGKHSSTKNNLILMQYTGLKDINDKEIYEGDLHLSEFEIDGKTYESYLPVVFDNGAFWLDESFEKNGSLLGLLCEYDSPINIISNIHQNPELLK